MKHSSPSNGELRDAHRPLGIRRTVERLAEIVAGDHAALGVRRDVPNTLKTWKANPQQGLGLVRANKNNLDIPLKAPDGIDSSAALVAIASPLIMFTCWAILTEHVRFAQVLWALIFR
jgi:hypothetical protein